MNAPDTTMSFDFQVRPDSISLVHNYLEGIEGVGVVRTVDASLGLITIWVAPDFEDEFHLLMDSLRDIVEWRPVDLAERELDNDPKASE